MIVMIDNYDSFTFNLVQYLRTLAGEEAVRVIRNDDFVASEVLSWEPRAVVVSPGPGGPMSAGISVELIRVAPEVPLLGVCLGHQALAVACGGRIIRAPEPRHGKVSSIHHDHSSLFAGLDDPFTATRYHSLVVERRTLPKELEVTAWSDEGLVMAVAHRDRPHFGVQFHPESILTQGGMKMIANFLELSGVAPGRMA